MPACIITGTVGKLEAKFLPNQDPRAPIAVLLHPAIQFGGTMDCLVLYQAYYALSHRGFSVLRFNFRGVGRSEGIHDHGTGELQDAADVLDWLQGRCPTTKSALVLGFGFGAWIGMQLVARRPEIQKFVCLAPPAGLYDFGFLSTDFIHAKGLIIGGEADAVAPPEDVKAFVDLLNQEKRMVDYVSISGANHFFDSRVPHVMEEIARFVEKGDD